MTPAKSRLVLRARGERSILPGRDGWEQINRLDSYQIRVLSQTLTIPDGPVLSVSAEEAAFASQLLHRLLGLAEPDFADGIDPGRREAIDRAIRQWLTDRRLIP